MCSLSLWGEDGTTLAELLSGRKMDRRLGDKRLADLGNEHCGIPILNRSSIRNWSDGSSANPKDWRALVAMGAALQLSEAVLEEMLSSAGAPDLSFLRRTARHRMGRLLGLSRLSRELPVIRVGSRIFT